MSTNIERVRYYDGEYLRSADFIAEQRYHVEMRRRLNRALHLWGIVDGLEILEGAMGEFYVTPGMAIDGFGRELFLARPKELSAADFEQGQFQNKGTYSVWARYRRSPETPASSGYRLCNAKDQLTRWQESIEIFISNKLPATIQPTAIETPPDDSETGWPVLLGGIDVDVDATGGPTINAIATKINQRTYVGLRARHLTSPTVNLDPLHPDLTLPIQVELDLRAEKNLIVGKDFSVNTANVKPTPTASPFPGTEGNVRIASDLFLTGEFYKDQGGGNWLALKEYIRSLLPDIQLGTKTVAITATANDPSTGTFAPFAVTSTLAAPSSAQVLAAISGIQWKDKTDQATWYGTINPGSPWMFQLTASAAAQPGTTNIFDISLAWAVGPPDTSPIVNIDSLFVSYIVVFQP
jgi:hypothetical protein